MKKFNLLRGSLLIVMTLFYCYSYSQIPAGYYDQANGLSGDQLKAALHNIIDGHTTYPYSSSGTDTWDILKEADRDPQNPNNVIGIYSGFSMNGAAEYDGGNGWSREHVWAKSRGDFGTSQGAGTDVHHLRAEDVSTNSARSNRNFDYADYFYTDGSGQYSGATLSKTSDTDYVWEPRDEVKGDVARMIFYMVVRYEGTNGDPDLELTDIYQTSTSKDPLHAKLTTLIEWHLNDPVTDAERTRNDIIYGYQQNRNPFIDHPEYVCELYSSYCSNPPPGNNAPTFTSTAVTSANEGQVYTYNITTNDIDGDALAITASTQPGWLAFTDNGNGTAILSGTPGAAAVGTHNVVLNVNDGVTSTNQSFVITVNAAGTGGGDATDLFLSEYIEGSSYNKGLEVANFTGLSVDLSQYSIQKQTNGSGAWGSELVLSGTLANASVFVVVHSSADAQMQSVADLSTGSGPMSFNGNDAIGLFKNGTLIDIIGTFNDASNFAQDVTLVRKSSVNSPSTTYATAEWDQFATNTFSDLGTHSFDGGTPPPPPADTEAPSAPGSLAASGTTETSTNLSWSASTDNVGVTGYEVYVNSVLVGSLTNTNYTVSNLSSATTYTMSVVANDAAGNESTAASISVTTSSPAMTCASTVGVPYNFGFETGLGDWTQVSSDDFDWTRRSGGTPSSNTGPSSADQGSFYIYMESSSPNYSSKTAIIEGPCLDLVAESSATFNFSYHMYGSSAMGNLGLEATTDGTSWTTLWSKSGNQGSSWQTAAIDLSAYLGNTVKLRFNGTTGTTWQGDMAVDNISLSSGSTGSSTELLLSIDLDNYPEETTWQIRNGSTTVASGGAYGNRPDGSNVTETITLDAGCYDFIIYDSYGDGICCSYGSGYYELTAGSTILASGGAFGSSELTNFCVQGGSGARLASTGSTETTEQRQGFMTYPNPVKDILNIYTGKMGQSNYRILDINGRMIKAGMIKSNEGQIRLDNIPEGYYYLKVSDGNNVVTKQFIVQ